MSRSRDVRHVAGGIALVAALVAAAPAPAAAPQGSCVAAITSFEASQLGPGAVGAEASAIAQLGPTALAELVRALAKEHGTLAACAGLLDE